MRVRTPWRPMPLALVCMLLFIGCGVTTHGAVGTSAGKGAATSAATAVPTPLPTADAATLKACGLSETTHAVLVGGVVVSPVGLNNLAYPSWTLPDNTPLKPLKIEQATQNPFGDLPMSNPNMNEVGGGIGFAACNASQSAHTLSSISVRVASFRAYSGNLNIWAPCANAAYNTQYGVSATGCGGGDFANESLHATFAVDASTGATVVAAQTATNSLPTDPSPYPPLPLALSTGKTIPVEVGITVPTVPGTYSFAIGPSIDGAAPVFYSVSDPYVFAPVAHAWGGAACKDPAMQAQIPASSTPTNYICPQPTK